MIWWHRWSEWKRFWVYGKATMRELWPLEERTVEAPPVSYVKMWDRRRCQKCGKHK